MQLSVFPTLACSNPYLLTISLPPPSSPFFSAVDDEGPHAGNKLGLTSFVVTNFFGSPAVHPQLAVIESRGVGWVLSKLRIVAMWLIFIPGHEPLNTHSFFFSFFLRFFVPGLTMQNKVCVFCSATTDEWRNKN